MKKVSALMFAAVVIFSCVFSSHAAIPETPIITPQFTYITWYSTSVTIDESTGISRCEASCYADADYTVEVECSLQWYVASNWTTIKTWSATGTEYAGLNKNWAVYSGYTYRVYSVFRIYDSAGNFLESAADTDTYVYPSKN